MLHTDLDTREFAAPSPAVYSIDVPKVSRVMEEVSSKFTSHFLANAKNPPLSNLRLTPKTGTSGVQGQPGQQDKRGNFILSQQAKQFQRNFACKTFQQYITSFSQGPELTEPLLIRQL